MEFNLYKEINSLLSKIYLIFWKNDKLAYFYLISFLISKPFLYEWINKVQGEKYNATTLLAVLYQI